MYYMLLMIGICAYASYVAGLFPERSLIKYTSCKMYYAFPCNDIHDVREGLNQLEFPEARTVYSNP